MAKKQFIRHLEFYGFPDQNSYSSDINGVDLSEIIEKNKEQDEEIQGLEGEKADKKDLYELSGSVETLISAQTEFNNAMVETISGITNDINTLKDVDNEFGQQISALTDGVNDAIGAIQVLEDKVNGIEGEISGINESIETITEGYAKKEDVYSKEEIDEMISSGFSGYATQEWVEEQGYITEEEADARYAKIEDLQDLASQVESAATDIDGINDAIDEINVKIDTLNNDLSELDEDVSESISEINDSISGISDKIDNIENDIAETNEAVAANTEAIGTKASTEYVNSEIGRVEGEIPSIENLATKAELSGVRTELKGDVESLESTKADKADLDTVSGAVDTLSDNLESEIADRIEADRAVNEAVAGLNGRVTTAEGKVDTCVTKVDEIESGLTKEIAERKAADFALIGESTDTSDDDTIWGAKKKAAELAADAVNTSKNYTNGLVDTFEAELAELSAKTDEELSKFATREYVNARVDEAKTTLRSEIQNSANAEKNERIAADVALGEEISTVKENLLEEIAVIDKNSTILNAFTDWDGEGEYDDSGNGIVDIMHREIHDLNPEGIEEIKAQVNANTEAISANTADIAANTEAIATKASTEYVNSEIERVEEEIPSIENLATKDELNEAVSGKADADAVYTKEEVDELLAAKDAEIEEIQEAYNNLKNMVLDLYYATSYSIPADSTLDSMLKSKNGEAKLTEDITTGIIAAGTTAKNIVKLNLGGKTVTFTGATTNNPAMMFRNKQQVNIGGSGTIDAGGRIAVEAYGADCEITLSGTMFGRPTYTTDRSGGELIYCYLGTINITEGIFKNTGEDKTYLLNCYDANYRNGTANIVVTGGKFYDFNPADNTAEGPGTSFVPEGYHVEESTDGDSTVYTVKKD